MSVKLKQETQELVDTLLEDEDKGKRSEALQKIMNLPDKDQVENYLLELLVNEKLRENSRWRRTWTVSALAGIGLPDGVNAVLDCLDQECEADPWIRHFALIYAANFDPFPMEKIQQATNDAEVLPKATALRLLLGHGEDRYADELTKMIQDTTVPNARWAAARALRNRSEVKMAPLRTRIEEKFIPNLVRMASDPNTYLDTRWEAIQALASFTKQKTVAAELANLLIEEKDPTHRRYYLEALSRLNQPAESQHALLKAIEDADAQIRLDAATALSKMLGPEKSIKMLLPVALGREKDTSLLVDALRHIDPNLAAKEIRDALSNPDIVVSTRANQLLTMLGGQAAAQILLNERAKALDNYTAILNHADEDVTRNFTDLMSQAKISFWLSMTMHIIVFGIGIATLIGSFILAFQGGLSAVSTWVGVGGVGTSALLLILSAFYRNPLQNLRRSMNLLMQVDVVFLGYVRQINQIDATFKHMFLDAKDFGPTQMQATVAQIQTSVKEILEEIQNHIVDKEQ